MTRAPSLPTRLRYSWPPPEPTPSILERIERDCHDALWLVSEGQATAPGLDKIWPSFVLGNELEQTAALMAGRPWIVEDEHAPECADRESSLALDPPCDRRPVSRS